MEKINSIIKKQFRLLYFIILTAALAAYLAMAFGQHIWSDEAYTFAMLRHSFGEMCAITAADVHPPLYYIAVKLLTMPFGYSLLSVKAASVIPFIVILAFGGIQVKRLFDEKTAVLFMVLFFLFPFIMAYAVEARMYSMAAAFVFVNAVYAYRCYTENSIKNWILFALSAAAAAYTHYFALVSVGIIYGLIFIAAIIKKRGLLKYFLAAAALTVILYLPWLRAFTEQLIYKVNNEYWIEAITPLKLVKYWYNVFGAGGMKTFALFSSLAYLAAFIYVIRSGEHITLSLCLLAVPLGTVFVGVAASLLVRPVFLIRYVSPSIALMVLFMAIALGQMKSEALAASVLTVSIMGGVSNYAVCLKDTYSARENRIDAAFTDKYNDLDCYIVYAKAENISYMLSYYEPDKPVYRDIPQISPANPFTNQKTVDTLSADNISSAAVLTDEGRVPPKELTTMYSCVYSCTVNENGQNIDVYLLSK